MSGSDARQLAQTLFALLQEHPSTQGLRPDADGWVSLDEVSLAAGRMLECPVDAVQVRTVFTDTRSPMPVEISGQRLRVVRPQPSRPLPIPDILYHATTVQHIHRYRTTGALARPHGRNVFLSENEAQAWTVAHRFRGEPAVLYVDTQRARRGRVHLSRTRRTGLFHARSIPLRAVLNLHPAFDVQLSAGGIPMTRFPDGQLRLALVQVDRRGRKTWEVAKGKLEPGEHPEGAAVREVLEEMGFDAPLRILRFVDHIRYGFNAPGYRPRLKLVFLYLMVTDAPVECFRPASREGIAAVKWFTAGDAVEAVTHPSLQPVMQKVKALVELHGLAPDTGNPALPFLGAANGCSAQG